MLYQEDLETATCGHDDCEGCAGGPLFLGGQCHKRAPVRAYYSEGGLHIECAICQELVVSVAVARRAIH